MPWTGFDPSKAEYQFGWILLGGQARGTHPAFSLYDLRCILPRVTLSVVLITQNEERNLPRTLESVMPLVRDGKGEIIVVDSGSTDRTIEIAQSYGAKIFVEAWKGFAAQKNSAIEIGRA